MRMLKHVGKKFAAQLRRLQAKANSPLVAAGVPALCFAAYWLGGENGLIMMCMFLPAVLLVLRAPIGKPMPARDGLTQLMMRQDLIKVLDQNIAGQKATGRETACLILSIDDFKGFQRDYGPEAGAKLIKQVAQRLSDTLRERDAIARLEDAKFAIALAPILRADLENLIQLSARLQSALSEPFSINAAKVYTSCSIGFCLPRRAPARSGAAFLDAAEVALVDARHNGSGSIRAYTPTQAPVTLDKGTILAEAGEALENGQIVPWFQPQVSTDTGTVSGMEALARWEHPSKGVIPPGAFLPALEELGLLDRLGEVILYQSLMSLKAWEEAGFDIPAVSVNFSHSELSNPKLIEKIRWELDRFELAPNRLSVEVLESVVAASDNDIVIRNIWALKELGCQIELDDFGTGHASIANIRRFAVDRIKIDRSYVTRCDLDPEQQNLLAGILVMAERIGIETLAEGVETVGEHALLAQLGCGHVQGFSISRPIPFEKSLEWIDTHHKKLAQTPSIGRRAS